MINVFSARRVSALSDGEINALLAEHLFSNAPLCLGIAQPDEQGVWRCPWCGEVDDRTVPSRLFDDPPWHRRATPSYTIAEIVEKLQNYSESAQTVYALSLEAQIFGESEQTMKRSPTAKLTQRYMHLSDRVVGIAALTALGIIDERGFVREG